MSQGYSGPPQSSGSGGGNVLVIVLVIVGAILLLCAGACGGCYLIANRAVTEVGKQVDKGLQAVGELAASAMMHSQATLQISQNPQVIEKLGTPVEVIAGSMPNLDPQATSTNLAYTVRGPKGTASASGEGRREGNTWKLTTLRVQFADGSTVDIDVNQPFQIPLDGNQPTTIPDVPHSEIPSTPPTP